MKGLTVYRVLSIIINLFALFIACVTLFSLAMVLANPGMGLVVFMMAGVVLYAWFSRLYLNRVILSGQSFSRKNKDWLQVNAIVTIVFCVSFLINSISLVVSPGMIAEVMKAMTEMQGQQAVSPAVTSKMIMAITIAFSVVVALLLAHVIWTLMLVRKNRDKIEG